MRELALALVSAGVPPVVAVSLVAMWLTGDWRALGLVILSAGLIGTGLAGYFHWRAKLRRRIIGEPMITGALRGGGIVLRIRTAIECRDTGADNAMLPATAGADLQAADFDDRRIRLAAERALDEVLADSFPASDPPSWTAGVTRPAPSSHFA